ncbi:MAG TPA: DNA polymerase III subunit chi [Alphaproteobacteria bacterium]|nr:DNA polymerase III subunit chi [Alphaproteobacteria bacterium]
MTDIGFYHLQRSPLERALPKLLEKVLEAGKRAVVVAGSDERVESLNGVLWTYRPDSFLPHGSAKDGNAENQPVWLATVPEKPNGADILILTDGATTDSFDGFDRCLELFDGNDDAAVTAARERWAEYKAASHAVVYYQQTESGGWEQKA